MHIDELRSRFEASGIRRVKVGGFDIDGVLRGKYLSLEKFWSVAEKGFGFCDVIFGWDIDDRCYDNVRVTGSHSGYPDIRAVVDTDTFRVLPFEPDTAAFLLDFKGEDQKAHPACPRGLLKRIVGRAEASGFRPKIGAELEFWVFRETPESVREKRYAGLTPLSPGMCGYSWLRTGQHRDFVHDLLQSCDAFDIPVEGFHTETGPGVYEVALRYGDAVVMADRTALFKTLAKEVAARHGLMVTFMAKWNAGLPGSSGHLHQSVMDSTESKNLLADPKGAYGLSPLGLNYLAGLLHAMVDLTAVYAPTINSYKRYVPGVWAPLFASWGIENRTTSIRLIRGDGPGSTRLEYRQTAADLNPYLCIAATLGAGLYGIENALVPPPPVEGDASATMNGPPLPNDLAAAATLMGKSELAKAILGEPFVDHYVRTREWEVRAFEKAVTDWELARYFESI
jgi:glutamine synthetase